MNKPNNSRNKVSRRIRSYREGYVSISVYLNVLDDGREFHDIVIYRKIKESRGFSWKRATNYKPKDLPIIIQLLSEANAFLETLK